MLSSITHTTRAYRSRQEPKLFRETKAQKCICEALQISRLKEEFSYAESESNSVWGEKKREGKGGKWWLLPGPSSAGSNNQTARGSREGVLCKEKVNQM